jgi:RNA polymerase sigma factor (sigma-70 family)
VDGVLAPRLRVALSGRVLRVADDERLVAEVRVGNRGAFEVVYDRHHAGILAFCRHMLGSREEAEDVVQQTFAAAYQALLADDRDIALKAWLYAIARNRCLSVLRVRREHVELDDAETRYPATAGLSVEVEQREDLRALLDDLQRLPDEQRAALVLAELGAHSHEEIAVVLGVPTPKIKALIFQAREALMIRRLAREADCGPIREQLAVLRGGSRRRRELRHHVSQCDGCRAFEAEVRRQRAGLAVLLPVVPTLALKDSSLAAAFAASGGGAAAAGGAAAGGAAGGAAAGSASAGTMAAGGGAAAGGAAAGGAAAGAGGSGILTGGGALLGKAIGAKAVVALALTGVAGGGYATVEQISSHRSHSQAQSQQAGPARPGQNQNLGIRPPAGVPLLPATHGTCPKDRVRTAAGCLLPTARDLLPGGRPTGFPGRQDATGTVPSSVDNCSSGTSSGGACPNPAPGASPPSGQVPGTPMAGTPTRGDRDGDGVPNRQDTCPKQSGSGTASGCPASATGQPPPAHPKAGDRDGDGIPNSEDPDRDGDGFPNRQDSCPNTYGTDGGCPKSAPGAPAPGGPVAGDRDGDGFPNRQDNCPNTPGTVGGCPEQPPPPASQPSDPSSPATPAPGDRDGDGIPNAADQDRDNDGLVNREDNCPNKAGPVSGCPEQVPSDPPPAAANDRDADGIADNVDVDRDNDGFFNIADNCPNKAGPDAGCPAPPPAPAPAPAPPPAPPPPPPSPPPADTTTSTTP